MMIDVIYAYVLGLALFAIGIAGIAADRHFIVIMLAIELMFAASTVMLVAFFAAGSSGNSPDAVTMLFAIFSVAAAEIIAVVSFYVYMKHNGIAFDVSKLSEMRW